MKKKIITIIIALVLIFTGLNIYAQSSGLNSTGDYVVSLGSGENIQAAINGLDMNKDEIKNAKSIIIELDGNFSNQTIDLKIDKEVTIKGKSSGSMAYMGWGKITISEGSKAVNLENLQFFGMSGSSAHEFIVVDTPVNLKIDNVTIEHASRPPDGASYDQLTMLRFTEKAANSTANISNSKFSSIYQSVSVTGSGYNLTFDNTYLEGTPAFAIKDGENNHITFKNNSRIVAGSSWTNTASIEGVSIKNQKNMQFDFVDSSALNQDRTRDNHLFSFDDANNQNCTISITGNSTINDENNKKNSKIFDFELDVPSNNNKIYVGKDVVITPSDVAEKYSTSSSSYAVGIHDEDGNATIRIYNGVIPSNQLKLKHDNYTLKGWYKNKELTEEFTITSAVSENMDLYPKYTYPVSVKVKGLSKEFTMQSDETLETLESRHESDLDSIKNPSNKTFSHFTDEEGNKIDSSHVFIKDITLIPIYNVTVTYKGDVYTLESGQTLKDLDTSNRNKLTKATEVEGKDFDHFVIKDSTTLVDDSYKFEENTILDAKYTITIIIGSETFKMADGSKLSSLEGADLTRFNSFKNVDNKIFKHFEIKGDGTVVDENATTFNKHTELVAKYSVKITFKGKSGKEIVIDEDQTLKDLKDNHQEELDEITKAENKKFAYFTLNGVKVEDDHQFNSNTELELRYTVKVKINTSKEGSITFSDVEEKTTLKDLLSAHESELQDVINNKKKNFKAFYIDDQALNEDYQFNADTEMTAKYTVNVTFNDEFTITVDEGTTIDSLTGDNKAKLDALKEKIKENFDHYEKDDGTLFGTDDPIEEHIKLYLKYQLTIKIGSETLTLPLGKTIEALSVEDRAKLENIINPLDKTFVKFQSSDGKTISKDDLNTYVFNSSMELTPIYNVEIKIGTLSFTLAENQTLNDLTKEQKEQIQDLINSSKKTFKNYQIKDGEVIDNNYKFTRNTELVINYQITVKVKDQTFIVDDNAKLSSLTREEQERLNSLVTMTNKNFKEFKDSENKVVDDDYVFTYNTTLTATYEITVKIGEEEFTLDEGQTLNDLTPEGQEALNELKNNDTKTFNRFTNQSGLRLELNTELHENTTVIVKFNIIITVGDEEFVLGEDESLNDLSSADKERLQGLINPKENQEFDTYINSETGEKVDYKTKFTKDTTLEIAYRDKKVDVPSTPKTYDNVFVYILGAIIGLVGIVGSSYTIKKMSKN